MAFILSKIWKGQGGCGQVLKIALPLILSTSAMTIQLFVDRVFLMWYDREAMSAAMLAGILNFTAFSFFLGTAAYVNTFVSQYDGAGRPNRIGAAIWQSIYFSVAAGILMAGLFFFAEPIMNLVGHAESIRSYETTYYKILVIGAMPALLAASMSCFYTGRGKTLVVMWIAIVRTAVNIIFDYALIFGNWNMPRLGIAGAAIATVISTIVACMIYLILFFNQKNRRNFATARGWRFDRGLFGRLMRFGIPSGVQFMLDIFGFAMFIVFVGRIDTVSFAATSMTCQINTLSFLPMIGFSIATSTLVGRAIGRNDPALAQRSTYSAAAMTLTYMTLIAAGYWFFPQVFMYPFKSQADLAQFEAIRPIVEKLLCFVAVYCIFDTGNLIFSAALKGAGDTFFVMVSSTLLNWIVLVIPSCLAITFLKGRQSLYVAWFALTSYVSLLAILFLCRFLNGKWKTMRVIEMPVPTVPSTMPELPTIETESI